MQEMWNGQPGFRHTKSAPSSPAKPLGISRTSSASFHITHKVPVGDTPYVRAKNVQLVDKDPERAIPLFWAAINAGDRVDSALKDMAIVMKQQNRAGEAIEAIKSLRSRCSDQAQESLDNILLDLYKRCGRIDDQIGLLRHKLYLIQQGMAFNGKRTKTARSQGKKFQVSVEQEATRLLGNLGWALMQQNNYVEAEEAYRRALLLAPDNNKMCNLGICLMKQGRIAEAKETLQRVKPAGTNGPRGVDSHLKAYERAQQMLLDLESETMKKGGDRVEQRRLFDAFLGSSTIWQPQPCKENSTTENSLILEGEFADENTHSNINSTVHSQGQKGFRKCGVLSAETNALNVAASPFFYSSKYPISETLKRTRSGNMANQLKKTTLPLTEPEVKTEKQQPTIPPQTSGEKWADFLPDCEDFEEAIIAAVLGLEYGAKTANESKSDDAGVLQKKVDKRLKVFQEITPSLSPRA
ncbi:protein POLLENLESS 3-LIKE 2-like [Primulina huaijiensis]|uniref:protein POLLENLESS 3-LIKE 2-like n=1 Tax=Primulina huaijiensis TaxID=1492673 RepID=UPI003CC6E729